MDGAIGPDVFTIRPKAPETVTSKAQLHNQREVELAQLTQYPGWRHFADSYRRQIQNLRTLADVNFEGMSFEEIGQRTMAAHLAADRMEGELIKVEATAKIVFQKNQVAAE